MIPSKMTCLLWMLQVLFLGHTVRGIFGKTQLCDVESGQTNIILDIEESRGSYIGQHTTPAELPIFGDPFTEISLELIFSKGNPQFLLNGKTLQLLQPLDRDEENISHIVFQISCTIRSSRRKRNIPIIVRVSDVNDNAPVFENTPYQTAVPESTPVGTTIFRHIHAVDKDAGVNGLVEYFVVEGEHTNATTVDDKLTSADGFGVFAISFPHQGQVTVVKTLDYERIQKYYLTVVAADRARNASERLSATTTLTIDIEDSDDLDPSFIYRGCAMLDGACIDPKYTASVPSGSLQGVLAVQPERIQAVDLDTIEAPIRYAFVSGQPATYADFFEIDAQSGVLKQIKIVDTTVAKRFAIVVRAQEESEARRFTTAKLTITVKPVDANPPVIVASDIVGYVDENSPVGTVVTDAAGEPLVLRVTDADLAADDPRPRYLFELTTPSFAIAADSGVLTVNEPDLDRDPPSPGQFRFQIVAREATNNAASAPLSVTVILRDVNDNAPRLPMVPALSIPAGDGRRPVTRVHATDNDAGENAEVQYSIYHVSNNGGSRFSIDSRTGEIETRGRMSAGEQYSITVQATDTGGLYTQAIVEVSVSPGPNTKPPRFERPVYEVQVSEGAEINATVAVVRAIDPEDDPVRYAIMSGNDLRQFAVGPENGVISVIRALDREDLTRYQLLVRAEDAGGLAGSATVNIKVTDINDKNPEFDETDIPYMFTVPEGQPNATVGTVHATDADEGINAEITYSLPADVPFRIDGKSGAIRTRSALDYETQTEYRFVVTAKDGAPDARLGTASVTVRVLDVADEVPRFADTLIEVRVPENLADHAVTKVHAHDPDTVREVTYTLRRGPADLFRVDAATGQVYTQPQRGGLDYERERRHELIIGTLENAGDAAGDTVRVRVEVEDRNDVAPVFVSVPEAVTVADDQPIGTVVAAMPAIDGDGTAPANVVRYEMVGRGKALKYFQVDADTGAVRLRDELHKEADTEYQVDVRAFDLGEPSLSAVATLPVYVRHVFADGDGPNANADAGGGAAAAAANRVTGAGEDSAAYDSSFSSAGSGPEAGGAGVGMGLAFSDDSYTASVPETLAANGTVKVLQIINAHKARGKGATSVAGAAFACVLSAPDADEESEHNGGGGDDDDDDASIAAMFRVQAIDHACAVTLRQPLDYETRTAHTLRVQLTSGKYMVNGHRSVATLHVLVLDANDNAPEFVLQTRAGGRANTFYAVVPADADVDAAVMQVRATDRDSGRFGTVRYRLHDETDDSVANGRNDLDNDSTSADADDAPPGDSGAAADDSPSSYFTIAEDTGMLKTLRSLRSYPPHKPFVFLVEASDNNGAVVASDERGDTSASGAPAELASHRTGGAAQHRTVARIVINPITDANRMTLVFGDAPATAVRAHGPQLASLLGEHTAAAGLIAGIERFSSHKYLHPNGTVGETPAATDMWFYVLDAHSERLLPHNASAVRTQLFADAAATAALKADASSVAHATALGVFEPVRQPQPQQRVIAAIAINDDVYSYTMIAIAVIILVLGSVGIVYICVSWSRYKNFKQRMRQYSAPASPTRYDPVVVGGGIGGGQSMNGAVVGQSGSGSGGGGGGGGGSESGAMNFKEYETQVLAMAVPHDEGDDLQLDFSAKNHAFSLDNVSYITHKENGQSSPTNSEATTAVVTTLRRNNHGAGTGAPGTGHINNNSMSSSNNNNNGNTAGAVNLTHNNNRHQNTFNRTLELNRNNAANPASQGILPGTLTLGRLKSTAANGDQRNNYQNGYGMNTIGRNNLQLAQNNTFNTMGRNGSSSGAGYQRNLGSSSSGDLLSTNTLGRNNHHHYHHHHNHHHQQQQQQSRFNDLPIANPLFHNRRNTSTDHSSTSNDNVTFGKRDYGPLGFSYLNDLDRSEVETTTEL